MKNTLILVTIFSFFSCNQYNYKSGISYLMKYEALEKNISTPKRYISHKNFLFEFVTQLNVTDGLTNGKLINKEVSESHDYINVLTKDFDFVFQIDSFKINCKLGEKINLSNKKGGITLSEPDEMTKQLYKKFSNLGGRDTTINSVVYKMKDTTYTFNDSLILTNNTFFIKKKNLNTVFNIKVSEQEKSILPYTLAGITAKYKNDIIAKYLISDFSELTNKEVAICDDIIKRIGSFMQE